MAKQSGAVNLSVKLGDQVFTDGKHGKHDRTSPCYHRQYYLK